MRSGCWSSTAIGTWARWSGPAALSACSGARARPGGARRGPRDSPRTRVLLPCGPMRRATPARELRARAALACALGLVLGGLPAGCGGHAEKAEQELTFEKLPDTTGLSAGPAVLERFEPYRMSNGAVRVSGRVRLPDGTKLQSAMKQPRGRASVAMAQVFVRSAQFATPPLLGEHGPLPEGDYRFELLGHFDSLWQSPDVMRAMDGGVN